MDTEVDADDSELASDSAGEPTPVVCGRVFLFLGRPFNFGAGIFKILNFNNLSFEL